MASASKRGGRQAVSVDVFQKMLRAVAKEIAACYEQNAALEARVKLLEGIKPLAQSLPGQPITASSHDLGAPYTPEQRAAVLRDVMADDIALANAGAEVGRS